MRLVQQITVKEIIEVAAELIAERDEAQKELREYRDGHFAAESRERTLKQAMEELKKERTGLLAEKTALTSQVLTLQAKLKQKRSRKS